MISAEKCCISYWHISIISINCYNGAFQLFYSQKVASLRFMFCDEIQSDSIWCVVKNFYFTPYWVKYLTIKFSHEQEISCRNDSFRNFWKNFWILCKTFYIISRWNDGKRLKRKNSVYASIIHFQHDKNLTRDSYLKFSIHPKIHEPKKEMRRIS